MIQNLWESTRKQKVNGQFLDSKFTELTVIIGIKVDFVLFQSNSSLDSYSCNTIANREKVR